MFLTAAITTGIFSGGSYMARTVSDTEVHFAQYKFILNGKDSYFKGNTEAIVGYETVIDAYRLGIYGFGGFSYRNEAYIKNYKFSGIEVNAGTFIWKDFLGYLGGGVKFCWMQSVKYKIQVLENDKETLADKPSHLQNNDAPTTVFTHPFICAGIQKRYKSWAFELKYCMLFGMKKSVSGAVYQFDEEPDPFANNMLQKDKIIPEMSFFTHQVLIGIKYYFKAVD